MQFGRRVGVLTILGGLGTGSAAIHVPARFSNINSVSWPTATPAYRLSATVNAANYVPQRVEERPIATNGRDCNANRTDAADRKPNPASTRSSGLQSHHESIVATGWNASGELGTATHRLSTLPTNGSTSASTAVVGLAAILLDPATSTSAAGHVPTPQSDPGARQEQNVDPSSPSSLSSAGKQSPHTTLDALHYDAGFDDRRQIMSNDDNDNTADIQPTSTLVDGLISAVNDVATLSGADPTRLAQGTATTTADPTNALDVLLSALPSSVASSLESQFEATATHSLSTTRSTSTSTTSSTSRRTTTSSISSTSTSSSSSFSTSTLSTSSISSTSSSPSSTSTNAPPAGSDDLENSAIAGIATGVTAGAVLIILAVVFFLRRRQQGKSPFGRHASHRSRGSGRAYPEVAWLYDPAPTPPNEPATSSSHHRRDESSTSLLPQVREPEMAAMYAGGGLAGNPYRSPEHRHALPESPLLPPHMPAASDSPSGSGSSSPRHSSSSPRRSARSSFNSSGDGRRGLHAIFEESRAQ